MQEIKKECAKGIVGSEELTLNKALDSASAAAQQCAAQASSLLKSCMKQSKTLSPDLKELAMIDSKAEERAKEIKKEKEIQDKVNESMKDLSFSSSSSTLAQKEEEVVTMPHPGEQVEVVAASNSSFAREYNDPPSVASYSAPSVIDARVADISPSGRTTHATSASSVARSARTAAGRSARLGATRHTCTWRVSRSVSATPTRSLTYSPTHARLHLVAQQRLEPERVARARREHRRSKHELGGQRRLCAHAPCMCTCSSACACTRTLPIARAGPAVCALLLCAAFGKPHLQSPKFAAAMSTR